LDPIYQLPYKRKDGTKGSACYSKDEIVEPFESLALDPTFLEHLKGLGAITKKIHIVWTGPNLLTTLAENGLVKHGVGALKRLNPEWEFNIYDVSDMDRYLQKTLPKHDWEMMELANLVTTPIYFGCYLCTMKAASTRCGHIHV
jgi:hypothetical protein